MQLVSFTYQEDAWHFWKGSLKQYQPPLDSALSELISVAAPATDFGFCSLFYATYVLDLDRDKQLDSSSRSASLWRKREV
jgi:hypothetical protein